MENLLTLLGLMFFMFLVIAAAVEVILEVFRGVLELFRIKWVKSKVSLDDALKLAKEFAPKNEDLNTKLQAIKSSAEQIADKAKDKLDTLKTIDTRLKEITSGGESEKILGQIAGELNEVAASVKAELDESERRRIFWLRLIAAIVGCFLAYQTNFYVFQMLAQAPEAKDVLANLPGLQVEWINVLIGGLAAAAGSSYWHDQLDKVRNLKSLTSDAKKLVE